jgi:hypothetical protein
MLLFRAVHVRVFLIPSVGGPVIIYSKEHIDILLVVSLFIVFFKRTKNVIPTPRRRMASGGIVI